MNSSRRAPVRSSPSRAAVLAGLLVLPALGAGAARAQYAYEPDMLLPPRAVVWRLNDRGFTGITRPRFDGRAYVVEASGPYGDRVRLFVDARDGAILGRQRLGSAIEPPPVRVVRPAPGYGWTEEDEAPRRPIREAERMMPPADIPAMPGAPPRRARPETAPSPARPEAVDRNPLGMNPDTNGRPEAPRKVVRLTPPAKAVAPRTTADSPKLADTPPAASQTDTRPPTAAIAPPPPSAPPTPAAVQPPPPEKSAAKDWKDPPADQKKSVRVIGGATIVPGTTARDEPAKN